MDLNASKIIIITGANSGIGYATAQYLYKQGNIVIFGSRNQLKNNQAIQQIKESAKNTNNKEFKGQIIAYTLDLSNRNSICQFVNNIRKYLNHQKNTNHIDILINNAGLLGYQKSGVIKNGVQQTILVNHFGHFYLTLLLLPLLNKSINARIINVSSDAYHKVRQAKSSLQLKADQYVMNDVWDLACQGKKYNFMEQYSISKLFNVLFTIGLHNLLHKIIQGNKNNNSNSINNNTNTNIKVVALHPGFVDTNFGSDSQFVQNIKKQYSNYMVTKQIGCKSIIKLIQHSSQQLQSGKYYDQNGNIKQFSEVCQNQGYVNKLWKISEDMYGIKNGGIVIMQQQQK